MGKSVVVKGNLTSSEDMTVDGRVEGSIEMRDHTLTVGPNADIRADVVAKAVTISGAVTGTITAAEKVRSAKAVRSKPESSRPAWPWRMALCCGAG
jgi:cytoskeletal protein CcmA (bactofilin family)